MNWTLDASVIDIKWKLNQSDLPELIFISRFRLVSEKQLNMSYGGVKACEYVSSVSTHVLLTASSETKFCTLFDVSMMTWCNKGLCFQNIPVDAAWKEHNLQVNPLIF